MIVVQRDNVDLVSCTRKKTCPKADILKAKKVDEGY